MNLFSPPEPGNRLAGMTLTELREHFRRELYDVYLPFLEKSVVDRELGGFLCHVTPRGERVNTLKRAGTKAAACGSIPGSQKNAGWPHHSNRTQIRRIHPPSQARGDVFFRHRSPARESRSRRRRSTATCSSPSAAGTRESAGHGVLSREAKDILLKCLRSTTARLSGKHFRPEMPEIHARPYAWSLDDHDTHRIADDEAGPDPEIETVLERCLDAIMKPSLQPRYGLMNRSSRMIYHGPRTHTSGGATSAMRWEVLWFVMTKPPPKGYEPLPHAADRFARHLETAWDPVYGGISRSLNDVDAHTWMLDKILLFHCEALIGLMMLVEHTDSPDARKWYSRVFRYNRDTFDARAHGYNPWLTVPDRVDASAIKDERMDNYHYPQHLMLNLMALDRMIARGK